MLGRVTGEEWKQELTRNTGLDLLTVDQYVNDARRFAMWMDGQGRGRTAIMDAMGQDGKANPFRKVDRVEVVERPPRARTGNEWNTVRRMVEALAERDQGHGIGVI
jgi:hypothetical protein